MMTLTPVTEKFILHWGEMGSKWGINRTVAQIHALLYLSPQPLNAEAISETLQVARSNVSNSLKELQGWGIVRVVHIMGDRRDHFESLKDVWQMFQVILDERKQRECEPTRALLRECLADAEKAGKTEQYTKERLAEMLDFFETMMRWYEDMRKLPSGAIIKFVKMGGRLKKMLGLAS